MRVIAAVLGSARHGANAHNMPVPAAAAQARASSSWAIPTALTSVLMAPGHGPGSWTLAEWHITGTP